MSREKVYLTGFLAVAGILLFVGRELFQRSVLVTWVLAFFGTTAVAVLSAAVYRLQLQLKASRHELALKEAEVNFALQVQRLLFPRTFPDGTGLEFSAECIPARGISGDYYDVLQMPDGRLAFAIADISGKGIPAAILMANLQALLRVLVDAGLPPGEVCCRLNHHLYQVTESSRFATLFYAEWNGNQRRLRYVNAGHPLPILIRPDYGCALDKGGLPLGAFPQADFQVGEVLLQPQDMLVLYSDGIVEATGSQGTEFGKDRLEELVRSGRNRPLAQLRENILDEVTKWAGPEPQDDMTLVIVRVNQPRAEE
ncbi:MAG TPA: PP2C family protein-serine/threonine phosphatase [Acidobacteriota bacterium]|jgi:sigma-B regulation protein RsbU (phosphoserine phosphatase)|nr:PP2C family protein-serine/threonine phosphatase [Acidobacteriota bacterium]